jgi:hypothetical protein
VASLEAAVGFTNAIAGAMPTLTQLLASSSVIDVQVAGYRSCKAFQDVFLHCLPWLLKSAAANLQLCC